jgi:hypothetical protein
MFIFVFFLSCMGDTGQEYRRLLKIGTGCICICCRSLFFLLYFFLLAIMLSVLRYADSIYPFGVFKLSLRTFLHKSLLFFNKVEVSFVAIPRCS